MTSIGVATIGVILLFALLMSIYGSIYGRRENPNLMRIYGDGGLVIGEPTGGIQGFKSVNIMMPLKIYIADRRVVAMTYEDGSVEPILDICDAVPPRRCGLP